MPPKMFQRKLHLALASGLVLSYLLFLCLLPTTAGYSAQEARERWRQARGDEEKQWGDMSFPYFLMMMNSGSSPVLPSIWLVLVVMASVTMLFIRGTMD